MSSDGTDFPSFLSSVESIPQLQWSDPTQAQQRCMLLLVGNSGCGKSTFSQKLQMTLPDHYTRINQDELKSRKRCISKCRSILNMVKEPAVCPIIDRCNMSKDQRKYFLDLVKKEYPEVSVDCIWFRVNKSTCLRRCLQRSNHPTLPPQKARSVLNIQEKEFQEPSVDEGFRFCHIINEDPESFLSILNLYVNRVTAANECKDSKARN